MCRSAPTWASPTNFGINMLVKGLVRRKHSVSSHEQRVEAPMVGSWQPRKAAHDVV